MDKDLKKCIARYKERGWLIEKTHKGHLRWYPPKGNRFTVSSGTPSDHRAWRNHIANLKRIERSLTTA